MISLVSLAYQYRREMNARRNEPDRPPTAQSLEPPDLWFHSIEIGDGYVTKGVKPNFILRGMADVAFRHGLAGKTVLDIGAWDGFYSFEAERRGASRVLAADHFCWSGRGWGTKKGFDYARARLRSEVESIDVDVPDLDSGRLGTFDVALFLGVLYHLTDPYLGLQRAAAMTHDLLVVETVTAYNLFPGPIMRFYRRRELNNDETNFWAPNVACLRRMLEDLGFGTIAIVANGFRNPLISRHFAFASNRR
jgi:tRNA (mo5U34)-methyltransferase